MGQTKTDHACIKLSVFTLYVDDQSHKSMCKQEGFGLF